MAVGRCASLVRRRHDGKAALAGMLLATTALMLVPQAKGQSLEELNGNSGVALSNDGRFYVFNNRGAVYRTPDETLQIPAADGLVNIAQAMSGDGQVIVGNAFGNGQSRAFRWSAADGLIDLGTLGTDPALRAEARGVSNDGSRIVGVAGVGAGSSTGFVWVQGATGGVAHNREMYELATGFSTDPTFGQAISDNGNVAVGGYRRGGSTIARAMRWDLTSIDDGGGPVGTALGDLVGGDGNSYANAVSADGRAIVGSAAAGGSGNPNHAFLWREGYTGGVAGNEQMIDLGTLGGSASYGLGISSGGDYVVGSSQGSGEKQIAFRWTEEEGMVAVAALLREDGIQVSDDDLHDASDVSTDGRVIIGTIHRSAGNRAYLARLGDGTGNGGGMMDVEEYNRTLYASAGGIASAGQYLSFLPLNGAHHRPLMLTPSLSGDMCAWATGDFAHHGGTSTGMGLAEAGVCGDLMGGAVRLGGAVGTTTAWQDLSLGGSSRLSGQYVLGEMDWQPDGTPLLLSVTGMLGRWDASIDRAYSNGGATAVSRGETDAYGGVVRLRADWLEAATLGNTTINPWSSVSLGRMHVDGYTESGGPFPASFHAQTLDSMEIRAGLTATTAVSAQTKLSTTFEVVHRTGTAPSASGQVDGLFNFGFGGGTQSQTWMRGGLEIDHKVTDNLGLSASVHLASSGGDPSIAGSLGIKASF